MKEKGTTLADLSIAIAFEAALFQRRLGVREDELFAYVDERFRLIEKLGSGAFGVVYLAEDPELSRQVALKIMPRGDPDVANREGKMLAALKHPNVLRIFDHGQQDDYRWLVLELLPGQTLAKWCEGKSKAEILARYLEAGAGLDAAHRRGLVHQDFKPDNVRLGDDGHAVVVDFGLARNAESLDEEAPPSNGSGSGDTGGGTLLYMARERLLRNPGGPSSDQFSFCVALWEALAGERPFGFQVGAAERVLALSLPPRGGDAIPRRLRAVLERGMAPIPGERWSTMTTLLAAIEDASKPPSPWPWLVGSVCVGALALVLGPRLLPHGIEIPTIELPDAPAPTDDPDTSEALDRITQALDEHDHDRAVQALWNARPIAHREDRLFELLQSARHLAEHLEDEALDRDAIEVWMTVSRLSRDLGYELQAEAVDLKIKELAP